MVLERESHVYLSVIQRNKKCFSKHDKYDYSNTRLILGKINNDGSIEYIYGKMKMERELWEEEELEAGEYLVYVEIDWNQDEINEFVVSAYSRYESHFVRDEKFDHPEFLEKVYASCAVKYGEKTSFKSEGAPGCVKYSKMLPEGYGFNFFKNDSTEGSL